MDKKEKEAIERLLAKSPEELSETQKDYLRARRAYIGRKSQKKFAEILKGKK